MKDVEIKFKNEGVEGIIPVGTVLGDAVRRFGVQFDVECDIENSLHNCGIVVISGSDLLSPITDLEKEHFDRVGRKDGERLVCETTLIKPGEIIVMTVKSEKETPDENKTKKDPLVDEFSELPLEKKLASLLRMEAVALGETLEYVINSPFKVVEKAGEVMAEFGLKLEEKAKARSRPSTSGETKKSSGKSGGASGTRKRTGTKKDHTDPN